MHSKVAQALVAPCLLTNNTLLPGLLCAFSQLLSSWGGPVITERSMAVQALILVGILEGRTRFTHRCSYCYATGQRELQGCLVGPAFAQGCAFGPYQESNTHKATG